MSRKDIELKFYNTGDKERTMTLRNGIQTIRAHTEVAFPERAFTGALLPTVDLATVIFNGTRETTVGIGHRVTIDQDGVIEGGVSEGGAQGGYEGRSG